MTDHTRKVADSDDLRLVASHEYGLAAWFEMRGGVPPIVKLHRSRSERIAEHARRLEAAEKDEELKSAVRALADWEDGGDAYDLGAYVNDIVRILDALRSLAPTLSKEG